MDDAAKSVKEAAKKVSSFFKHVPSGSKFQGTGRKLGSSESGPPASRNAALKPPAPRREVPVFKREGPLPSPPPLQPEPQVTDELNIAAATIASSGHSGAAASKTLCSIIGNILRSPDEQKFRQLKCSNARVASTLAVPGVVDLLEQLGFQHIPEHSQEASASTIAFDPTALSGVIELPPEFPNARKPLFQGALALLCPLQGEAAAGAATSTGPHTATGGDAEPPSAPPPPPAASDAAGPFSHQSTPALQPPQVDMEMADADEAPSGTVEAAPPPDAAAADAPVPVAEAPSQEVRPEPPAPAKPRPQPAAAAAAASSGLGMSAEEWLKQNKKKRVISVGGVTMSSKPDVKKAPATAPATPAPPKKATDEPEKYSGRNTKVLLPTVPGTDVPDWFFERTGADLKVEFHRTRQAREQRETLMTHAHREKLKRGGRKQHTFGTIRVRFPEGVLLQGCFLPTAPAFEIHAWVQEHLRELAPFQLSSPALPGKVKHLGHEGTVDSAGLMPSFLLNFRWTDGPMDGPSLSDAAMAAAQMDD